MLPYSHLTTINQLFSSVHRNIRKLLIGMFLSHSFCLKYHNKLVEKNIIGFIVVFLTFKIVIFNQLQWLAIENLVNWISCISATYAYKV